MLIEELQALCDAATPGPYVAVDCPPNKLCAVVTSDGDWACEYLSKENCMSDAEFYVAARKYMPKLLAVARAAKSLLYESHGSATKCEQDLVDAVARLGEP